MTHPENWPIKGKPATNLTIQMALAFAVVGASVAFPVAVGTVGALLIVSFGGRTWVRELRREWRQ